MEKRKMKPFHLQYSRHLQKKYAEPMRDIAMALQIVNETNVCGENLGSVIRDVKGKLNASLDQNKREFNKIQRARTAPKMSREALKAKAADAADCGVTCASSPASPAPAVSASDEEGGDGDGEDDRGLSRHLRRPQPHHRALNVQSNSCRLNKSHSEANMDQKNALPFVVEHFDRVSDATHIDIAALKAITGKSRATLYRWIDKGILPKPRKLGPTHNFWTAGEIRRALSA